MPKTEVVFFQEENGAVPLVEWLDQLQAQATKKCLVGFLRLSEFGHELRRPSSAHLGSGIFELRMKVRSMNLRILYFFSGRTVVVASHGFVKQRSGVPDQDLRRALSNRQKFEARPATHAFRGGI